jgi:UDP-N-acetyl-D-glucosamine dehydrogenase
MVRPPIFGALSASDPETLGREVRRQGNVDLVVIGLGYVGLHLAREAWQSGMSVVGVDCSRAVVDSLNAGRSHVDDVADDDVKQMIRTRFAATTDIEIIAATNVIVICVPTPLGDDGGPDLTAVLDAVDAIAERLQQGSLVVLESTTYPGTTEELVRPRLERGGMQAGVDFALAFSPERIDPGNSTYGLRNTPKVVGGCTDGCGDRAATFYSRFVDRVVRAHGTREAEMAKLLENTYRHVNIALVNEMARFCHELDIDLWDVIRCASTKPFGFQPFYPGPGVGGHCIPIDPTYLSYKVRAQLGYPFRFVELAQETNNRMPEYVVHRVQERLNTDGLALKGASVLLLGVTYKPDVADDRESPARPIARRLLASGAELSYHDPHVPRWQVDGSPFRSVDLDAAMDTADIVVLLQPHSDYDLDLIASKSQRVLDTRGRTPPGSNVEYM